MKNQNMGRRQALQIGLGLGAALVMPSARACEFFTPTLRVTHPWTRVSVKDATTAIVCMKIDQVSKLDRLIGVETPVAEGAEIIGIEGRSGVNLLIFPGQELVLGESGVQLRLVKLTQPLLMARTYAMRLYFEKGGVMDTELNVDYMPA
ncbi:copper chaperone PCu(A)C [Aquabacterium sp.]|uniref:copper chaperone PCu(A)C n=1 Tax=Aquabacterium sp. TaxID=1872578 RepID=UPI00199569A9|nr:copper chaperone PCu(A)C [Aquabacterium sp.]MBC7699827.1 copper chaperone PCu(A)C [Aquabacterium sp.]